MSYNEKCHAPVTRQACSSTRQPYRQQVPTKRKFLSCPLKQEGTPGPYNDTGVVENAHISTVNKTVHIQKFCGGKVGKGGGGRVGGIKPT